MTNGIHALIGVGKDLSAINMALRAVILFIYTLILLRIAGRRSFGMHQPFDNLVVILLGAVLSRAVVGASPMIPTLVSGFVLALLHRLFGTLCIFFPRFGKWAKGRDLVLYKDQKMISKNLIRCQVSEKDIQEAIRMASHRDSFEEIDSIYMERSGQITIIKKT